MASTMISSGSSGVYTYGVQSEHVSGKSYFSSSSVESIPHINKIDDKIAAITAKIKKLENSSICVRIFSSGKFDKLKENLASLHMSKVFLESKQATKATAELEAFQKQLGLDPETPVTAGQGEYIIYRRTPEGQLESVSEEVYALAHDIFHRYSPGAIINRTAEEETKIAEEECINRYKIIKEQVKKLDPESEITFIPRIVYELVVCRKAIEERQNCGYDCELLMGHKKRILNNPDHRAHRRIKDEFEEKLKSGTCFHLLHSTEPHVDSCMPHVRKAAFYMNKALVAELSPGKKDLRFSDIMNIAKRELDYLKQIRTMFDEEKTKGIHPYSEEGPMRFFQESHLGNMGDSQSKLLILKSLSLECSLTAQSHFLLYRGGDIKKDWPVHETIKEQAHSLSFATGVLAGILYDSDGKKGAMAFAYMNASTNDAYAIAVPYGKLHHSPFFIPTAHTFLQISGQGEMWHSRTKVWKGASLKTMSGININAGGGSSNREHLQSLLDKGKFIQEYEEYQRFLLKSKVA